MRVSRVVPIALLLVFVSLTSLCLLFPRTQPGLVRTILRSTRGYHAAADAEEAMQYFHKAIGERDYETVEQYCTGSYQTHLHQAWPEARKLAQAIDTLRFVMDSRKIRSGKADLMLFWIDPFPAGFTWTIDSPDEDGRTWAVLSWEFDKRRFRDLLPEMATWRLRHIFYQPLLPLRLVREDTDPIDQIEDSKLNVELVEEDDSWKLAFPITHPNGRNVRETILDFLQSCPQMTAGLVELKNDLKANAYSISGFEEALRNTIRDSSTKKPPAE
jgi:hypothetical protein